MSSSSWPESSRKSPSLANTACTTWAPTPRERAPFEKGKTALCNRSPANKTPKPTLSRTCPPKSVPRAQKKMGTAHQAHQARSSDRPSPVRLRRHLSRHRLHHRAKGDSENLGSSRKKKKKKRLPPATRALVTGFTPRHLSVTPTPDGRSVSSTPNSPGGRHFSTALPRLLEFCYPHQDSLGLHSPILVGKIRGPALGSV